MPSVFVYNTFQHNPGIHLTKLARLLLTILIVSPVHTARAFTETASALIDVRYAAFASKINLSFDLPQSQASVLERDGATFTAYSIPGEGMTYERNRPLLPAVSRFIVVPPDAGLTLDINLTEPTRIKASSPPALCNDPNIDVVESEEDGIYPPKAAVMSEPMVIRGVRVVKITVYPVQYDNSAGEYLVRDHIQADVRYTNDPPVNPATFPVRRHRSREFLNFIQALAINGDEVGRDDPDDAPEYVGHYLVVVHQSALGWHIPFIEWRRKAGYKVDILSLTSNSAGNTATIRQAIQTRYNAYLQAGEDPFDQILLIGDRSAYDRHNPAAQYVLAAETGVTTFRMGAAHADYKYTLLEGNDEYPDVGYARLPTGSAAPAALAVGRLLAYEMAPRMQNPGWFTRGLVYSQHWGNNENSAWHPTIATNVRWGEEVLQRLGYTEITYYENLAWDQNGSRVGPVIRNALNAGCNIMIGRAENYYWRQDFAGVNNNTVFPINICVSGHGESAGWNMFRTGNGGNLKGPVSTTFVWGDPPTAPSNYTWLQLVNSLLCDDMTLGWSRVYANISLEKYFPNFNVDRQPLYSFTKTDLEALGDPGIQPWTGVPRQLEISAPDTLMTESRRVDVHVYDANENTDAADVRVTLYAPGNIPIDNAANYARWESILTKTAFTELDGMAHFILNDDEEFVDATTVYFTISGRDIRPEITTARVVTDQVRSIELAGWSFAEVEGNGDEAMNPGEVFDLSLSAKNLWSRQEIPDVFGEVTSHSPFVTVDRNEIAFGNVAALAQTEGEHPARIRIHPAAPDGASRPATVPQLFIRFNSGDQEWQSALKLTVTAPHFSLVRVFPSDTITFEARNLDFTLANIGGQNAGPMNARLIPILDGVSALRDAAAYDSIDAGSQARIDGESFSVAGNPSAIPGSKAFLLLILSAADGSGFVDTVKVTLTVGTPRADAPLGPDKFGYACYDDTDADWDLTPTYDWLEINPDDDNADVDGTQLNFAGNSPENIGETFVRPLGFETQFYGELFDTISITLNGFIAMGNQPRIVNFQNWPLDQGIGGGAGMLAPLWDDLRLGQGSGVFFYDDQEQGRKIIEWYRMRNVAENVEYTFQVILYDRRFWPTPSGDQNILFHYKSFAANNNIRNGDQVWVTDIPYASVGISSPDGTTGISYCYNNVYPVAAARLQNRRSLLFARPSLDNSRQLRLRNGWNVVSLNIALADSDVTVITRPLVETGLMKLMKDGAGRFYRASDGFNQIPYWDVANGYQILMERDTTLTVSGAAIPPNAAIHLEAGWNLKSYYPRQASTPAAATAGIIDDLLVLKDEFGSFYLPKYEYSNVGLLREGKGYFFNVTSPVELIYNEAGDDAASAPNDNQLSASHFSMPTGIPGYDMSLLLIGAAEISGGEAGAFVRGRLVGGGVFDEQGRCGLALWSDEADYGSLNGESIHLRLWNGTEEKPVSPVWIAGDGKYVAGGFAVGQIPASEHATPLLPEKACLEPVLPNPFNSRATIRFGLQEAGRAKMTLYNLSGRETQILAFGRFEAGWHSATLDATDLPAGVYLVRLEAGGANLSTKAVIVR